MKKKFAQTYAEKLFQQLAKFENAEELTEANKPFIDTFEQFLRSKREKRDDIFQSGILLLKIADSIAKVSLRRVSAFVRCLRLFFVRFRFRFFVFVFVLKIRQKLNIIMLTETMSCDALNTYRHSRTTTTRKRRRR